MRAAQLFSTHRNHGVMSKGQKTKCYASCSKTRVLLNLFGVSGEVVFDLPSAVSVPVCSKVEPSVYPAALLARGPRRTRNRAAA